MLTWRAAHLSDLPLSSLSSQDSATDCAAWSESDVSEDECMWNAEDEMCEMVMDDGDTDGSGSGSGEEIEEESVCFGDDLREDMDACNANAACMWESYADPDGDDGEEGTDSPMMGGMCAAIRCNNQVRLAGISRPSLLPVSVWRTHALSRQRLRRNACFILVLISFKEVLC